MYKPEFRLTYNIIDNIVKFEIARKSILDLDTNEEVINLARLAAGSSDIFHIGRLLNTNVTLNAARKIARGKTFNFDQQKTQYLANFRNAGEYIFATQNTYTKTPPNILLHLNKILINSITEEWTVQYRTGTETVPDDTTIWKTVENKSISANDIRTQSVETLYWFDKNIKKGHPLIFIPVCIYKLIRIAPLAIANELTILAVSKYLFAKSKLLTNGFLPIIKNFDVHKKEYLKLWKQAAETNNLTTWIENFIEDYADELNIVLRDTRKLIEQCKQKNQQPFLNLNERQLKILKYLQNIYQVKRDEYVEIMTVSTMTAYRDLNELVKKGLLKVTGKGRATSYRLISR